MESLKEAGQLYHNRITNLNTLKWVDFFMCMLFLLMFFVGCLENDCLFLFIGFMSIMFLILTMSIKIIQVIENDKSRPVSLADINTRRRKH